MTLYIITGPPAAGKTTYVTNHAKPGDITIDYDTLANTLTPQPTPTHEHTPHVNKVTKAARQAAIDAALTIAHDTDVYIIHSNPSTKTLNHYLTHDAQIITINPGQHTVLERCRNQRPWQLLQAAKHWYQQHEGNSDDQPITNLGTPSEPW